MSFAKSINIVLLVLLGSTLFGQAIQGELLGQWSDESLVPSTAHNNTYNEVWGVAVNDHEIAIIGSTLGTHFIDVTDPSNPVEIHVVEGGTANPSIIHRDFHDYQGYLYSVADEGFESTLQIIDMTNLPEELTVVYDDNKIIARSHNIFIDQEKGRLYSLASASSTSYESMRIYDLTQDPLNPVFLGEYDQFGGVGFGHVHDAFVRNDTAYLNLGPTGFAIVEFADVENPNVISVLETSEYPQSGYNHSGWLSDDGDFYYMADENHGLDMKVLDLRQIPDIFATSTFNAESTSEFSIPHNQIVHNNKLYVSYYFDGLQVYDLTDPINPRREMYYPTSFLNHVNGLFRGAWGVYPFLPSGNILVSDMQNGLFVVEGKLPTSISNLDDGENFEIAPNPSSGAFEIRIKATNSENGILQIMDSAGRVVLTHQVHTGESIVRLDTHLNAGMYFIHLSIGKESSTKRLLIQE